LELVIIDHQDFPRHGVRKAAWSHKPKAKDS
jgi:hypothetical protein